MRIDDIGSVPGELLGADVIFADPSTGEGVTQGSHMVAGPDTRKTGAVMSLT